MIYDRIIKGTYIETTGNMLKELLQFQDFLYRNFYNYERHKDIKPESNQSGRLEKLKEITVANLKFRPIIDQTDTFTYNALKLYVII